MGFSGSSALDAMRRREQAQREEARRCARQGPEVWNRWREEHKSFLTPNLVSTDTPNLSYVDLSNKNLSGANFSGTDLGNANLSGANLSGANLSGANLNGANLRNVKIDSETRLAEKWKTVLELLNNPSFGQNLSHVDLSDTDLEKLSFRDFDLSRVNLSKAKLIGADFVNANLKNANLSDAWLKSANLSSADLSGANLTKAYLGETNLSGANFSNANLTKTYLRKANLSGANFSNANLMYADLQYINTKGTNFRGCTFTGTNIFDWEVDSHTELGSVICSHYRFHNERRPRVPFFALKDGEFRNFIIKEFMSMHKQPKDKQATSNTFINAPNSNIGGINTSSGKIDKVIQNNNFNVEQQRTLAEAAKEIQDLLNQLSETYSTETRSQQGIVAAKAVEIIEQDPSFMKRVQSALKACGMEALREAVDNPLFNIVSALLDGFVDP